MVSTAIFERQINDLGSSPVSKALHRLLRLQPSFALHHQYSAERPDLEDYIGRNFERAYGATVTEFLPNLLSMQCQESFSAVAGIRPARATDLFLEQYIDAPIERMIDAQSPAGVGRSEIVEIGNLSATHRGATLLFFVILAGVLHEAGIKWAVFAATEQVDKIMTRLDFATTNLCAAHPERLGAAAAQWGTYYDTRPTVIAAEVAGSIDRLRRSALPAAALAYFDPAIRDVGQLMRARVSR